MPIKLAINTTSLLSPLTGIGQYTYYLCKQFLDDPDIDPSFFYGTRWNNEVREAPVQGIDHGKKLIKRFIPDAYKLKDWLQKRTFSRGQGAHDFDLYHEPNYLPLSYKHRLVLTVHDVSFIRYPEAHPIERIRALERFPEAVEKADAIITDSNFTARELIDCLPVDSAKVVPIHLGVTAAYHPRSEQEVLPCMQRYGLDYQRYILVVGTLEPRKNLKLVLDAYRSMPRNIQQQYPLAVIGMKGWGTDQIDKDMETLIRSGDLRLLGYVPTEDMPLLYAAAKLFVYPSMYEGFGLPPLEAMASGVPVITSNCASLPEVVGQAGVQVDALDVGRLREVVCNVLENREQANTMIGKGILQAESFTWEKCAAETVDVYKRVLGH